MPNIRFRDIAVLIIFCYTFRTLVSYYVYNDRLFSLYLLNLLAFNVALVGLSVVAFKLDTQHLRQLIGPRPQLQDVVWALLLGVAIAVFEPGIRGLFAFISAHIAPSHTASFWTFWGDGKENAFFNPNRAAYYAIAVLAGPFAEEFVFRGLILRARFDSSKFWRVAFISSAFFALLHFDKPEWISTFAASICLAYLYRSTRSLTACVLAHGVSNLLALGADFFIPHMFDRSLSTAGQIQTWSLEITFLTVSILLTGLWICRINRASTAEEMKQNRGIINMKTFCQPKLNPSGDCVPLGTSHAMKEIS